MMHNQRRRRLLRHKLKRLSQLNLDGCGDGEEFGVILQFEEDFNE